MKKFCLRTYIQEIDKVKDFLEETKFLSTDFIIASENLFNRHFTGKTGDATVCFKNKLGKGEPSDEMVNKLIEIFSQRMYKRIFAIGGGGAIDMAKIIVVAGGRKVSELMKPDTVLLKGCELIAIPTTCGSGSEVSNVSIMDITAISSKYGLVSDSMYPDKAILIPELLEELPYRFFLTSGIDGMVHGIESFLSARSNSYTELFSDKAIRLYLAGLKMISQKGESAKSMLYRDFLVGSNYAGIAFSNTGTGAVHAISYPLSGKYHVTHGEANAIFLVEILKKYKAMDSGSKLNRLLKIIGDSLDCSLEDAIESLGSVINKVIEFCPLREYGMKEDEVKSFSNSVILNQQRLLSNSYVALNEEDLEEIYRNLL